MHHVIHIECYHLSFKCTNRIRLCSKIVNICVQYARVGKYDVRNIYKNVQKYKIR